MLVLWSHGNFFHIENFQVENFFSITVGIKSLMEQELLVTNWGISKRMKKRDFVKIS